MSATDEVSSSKEEDDLLNEDLVHHNTGNVSDINILNKDSSVKPDTSGNTTKMSDDAALGPLETTNNEPGDKITSTFGDKAKIIDEAALGLSERSNTGSGDNITSIVDGYSGEYLSESIVEPLILNTGENISDNAPTVKTAEIRTQVPHVSALEEANVSIKEKKFEKVGIETEKVDNDLSDEILEEEDLELRWDEDDGVTPVLDNATESFDASKKDNLETEPVENSEQNAKDIINKLPSIETQSISEVQATESISEETIKKDVELVVEEDLLKEPEICIENTENRSLDVSVEYTEDELLKDDQPEDTEMMEIDTTDKNVIVSETTEGILATSDNSTIVQEKDSKSDELKLESKPNSPKETDIILADDNINEITTASKEIPETTAVQKTTEDPNLSNDSQELQLSMDVDSGDALAESSQTPFKIGHGLCKPDVMLEIPMLPEIYINDALDSPNYSKNDDSIMMEDQGNDNMEDNSVTNMVAANEDENMNDGKAMVESAMGNIKGKEISNNVLEAGGKKVKDDLEEQSSEVNAEVIAPKVDEAQPSTSTAFPKMTPDTSDEVPEMTDSLGLLAESFRVMDDDDDQDDDDGDGDDDDDSDQDDSSNQMTAEHSEDSNGPHSENEQMKTETDYDEKETGEMGDNLEDAEAEVNQCEEENIVEFDDMEEDDGCQYESTEKEKDGSENENDDDELVFPAIIGVSSEATIKIEKVAKLLEEKEKTGETIESQVIMKQENIVLSEDDKMHETQSKELVQNVKGDLDQSKDTVKTEKEVSVQSKDAVMTEKEVSVQPKDSVKKEKEDSTQSKDVVKKEKDVSSQPKDAATKQKKDSIHPKRVEKGKEVVVTQKESTTTKEVTEKVDDDERPSSRASSNDDCIEQPFEIETVKVSDDDDDEEPTEATKDEINNTATTEKIEKCLLKKEIDTEKMTLKDTTEKTEVEKTAEEQKTAVDENTAEVEKTGAEKESEKLQEVENATIDLTPPDQADNEGSQTVGAGTTKSSPSKLKNLTVSSVLNTNVLSIVELGESSSEDEIEKEPEHTISHLQKLLEAKSVPPKICSPFPKTSEPSPKTQEPSPSSKDVTSVNIPTGIDIMSTSGVGGNRSQIVTKEGEVVISGVSKPPPQKPARLNTSEVTIKTASSSEQTLVIPETKAKPTNEQAKPAPTKPKLSLEIFSLDSDEEETPAEVEAKPTSKADTKRVTPKRKRRKCMNSACSSGLSVLQAADNATVAYYDALKKKKPVVCQACAQAVLDRKQNLVDGIKNFTPLLQLDMNTIGQDLVEILDSESEDEEPQPQDQQPRDTIGEEAAKFLEENLTDLLNESWKKYKLDDRLKETQDELNAEILKLEEDSKEIDQMLVDCQRATDKLRSDLYATFEYRIQEMPPLLIYETPEFNYIGPETDNAVPANVVAETRLSAKRKILSNNEPQAKRPAIPLGYAPLDDSKLKVQENKTIDNKADDDKDISVVKLSAESAPADLPPPGELSRPALRVGMQVYAMKNAFGPWFMGKILEIIPKSSNPVSNANFTMCRIKFDHKVKNNGKVLPARCIAYAEPADVRMTIGTRLIALFKDSNKRESYYSGVVAEIPNPVNNYRYLVFFDDGYAQYVSHSYTRLVCECSPMVWEEVHPLSREFVREYLLAYPERPMVRLHEGQHLKTEWDGKWWSSRVNKVDASLAQVVFIGDGRREWIYRGSTRLAPLYLELRAAERHRIRPMPRSTQPRSNMMPYVEYTRSDEQAKAQEAHPVPVALTAQQQNEELRRQRAVAKKSTSLASAPAPPAPPPVPRSNLDALTSRVVYYTPKNAVKPYKLVPHTCSPKCKRTDLLTLKELRTYNPLAKPLLSGWERQIVRYKGQKEVMYRAPCGRRLRNMRELHRYLRLTDSELPVDLFDFYYVTHCLAEFVLNKCLVGKKDLSHGKENVPVPCINYYDDTLPEFCSYNTERTPTSGVPLNLDPEFLCGCDCTDDCEDKSKCACWKMTLEGARTIGLDVNNVGYEYKRLPEPLPSGIYECNSRCKCKQTCLNRVAQHPLQLKLQVFKTLNRGWGIRALNDVPKGSFLCVYAGNLLTDATANLDGLNEGDEYLAELDYIEVVEQMKEGYEEEVAEPDKKLDKKEGAKQEDSEEEPSSSSEEDDTASKTDKEDDDFRPGCISLGVTDFNKRLRKRSKKKEQSEAKDAKDKDKESKPTERNPDEDCITISDDDEVREPSRFNANPGMGGNDFISKYRSVRTLFGEDEACYIMDAKVQGNIGRYLNHSCSPNVFVQNVFVDTHDPRFPWVAFFALSHIKAGMELTWNYNYDIGSVPGKVLYCYCEAPNCRGRLL